MDVEKDIKDIRTTMETGASSDRYKIIAKLGEGVHGVVLKAIDIVENKYVAVKRVPLKTKYGSLSVYTIREIKVLQHCACKNILKLLNIYADVSGLSLVFDFIPHTLSSKLKDDANPICRAEVKSYTTMLFKGLSYLHSNGIMHRDIKPSNLLITNGGLLKICDFGLARLYSEDQNREYSPQVGTRFYRAPELLWGSQQYGTPIDLWAAGCVFAEMLRGGVPLFPGGSDIEQLALVVRMLGTPDTKQWPTVKSLPDYNKIRFPKAKAEKWENIFPANTTSSELKLIANVIIYNPLLRLTANQVLQHEYIVQ